MIEKRGLLLAALFVLILFQPTLAQEDPLVVRSEQLARFSLNYAGYLIDRGGYAEALEYFQTALESSGLEQTRMEALLGQAVVLTTYLDAPDTALALYQRLEAGFPRAAGLAAFRQGLLLYELDRTEEASQVLTRYLTLNPDGSFAFQAEALLDRIEDNLPPPDADVLIARPTLRVLLYRNAVGVDLSAPGGQVCIGPGPYENQCADVYAVAASNGRLTLDGQPTNLARAVFAPTSTVRVASRGGSKHVRGRVVVKAEEDRLTVVNLVDVEDYLLGVVPAESYVSWPAETLKAQAVAARTYALYQAMHRTHLDYDLHDDQKDQAYKGVDHEHPSAAKAVRGTAGIILTHENRPILAMYTANSGGWCADAGAVFNYLDKPYLPAHADPASLKGEHADWTVSFTLADIESRLAGVGVDAPGLTGLSAAETGPSGRVIRTGLACDAGVLEVRTWTTLRKALGLKDILFTLTADGDTVTFHGHGWGHGVGYSQWGAAALGRSLNHQQILEFYYPGARLVRQW